MGQRRRGLRAPAPARYAGSERSTDNFIRLARKTEWRTPGADQYAGLGQRVLATDADEVGLLEVRELTLAVPDA
ncbi:MAG: type VI secretion system accessory protein TagJ [Gammaproteobacteria bacterium]